MSQCNCIDQIGKLARERFGEQAYLDMELIFSLSGGSSRTVPPVLRIRYPILRKNGNIKSWAKVPVFPHFCQFCGKPLKKEGS